LSSGCQSWQTFESSSRSHRIVRPFVPACAMRSGRSCECCSRLSQGPSRAPSGVRTPWCASPRAVTAHLHACVVLIEAKSAARCYPTHARSLQAWAELAEPHSAWPHSECRARRPSGGAGGGNRARGMPLPLRWPLRWHGL